MKTITGRIMEEKLKHGYTVEDFSEYFGISEEEFLNMLKSTFSTKAYKGMVARLKKNKKRKTQSPVEESTKKIPPVEISKNDIELDYIAQFEALKLQKEEAETSLNSLELEHKALVSKRVQIRNAIAKYREQLLKLQDEINKAKTAVSSLASKLDEKLHSMKAVQTSISEKKELLVEVNTKIEAFQKVLIFVYDSGEFEIETELELHFSEDCEIFNELVKIDLAGQFTINQIKEMSKLLSLIKFLNSQNLEYELVFESPILKEFFEFLKMQS